MNTLNSSQRFWLLFATAFFVSAIVVIVVAWPKADPAVLADLRSEECGQWRALPKDEVLDVYPNPGDKCFALRLFLAENKSDVRSEAEYSSYLAGRRIATTTRILFSWAVVAAGLYALGWASVRLMRRMRPTDGQKAA